MSLIECFNGSSLFGLVGVPRGSSFNYKLNRIRDRERDYISSLFGATIFSKQADLINPRSIPLSLHKKVPITKFF